MNRRFWSLLLALLCCFCTVCADAESGPGLSGLEVTDLDPFSPETEEVFPPDGVYTIPCITSNVMFPRYA